MIQVLVKYHVRQYCILKLYLYLDLYTNACAKPYPRNRVYKGAMEEVASSKDENKKSVVFGKSSTKQLKNDCDQQASSPQSLSQTPSTAVNAKASVKIEDKLNYYHLVELNELFKV